VRRESTTSRRSAYPQGVAAADPDDLLATGSAALAAGQWAGARAAFEDALAREPTAEAHAGLADVLWWVGETQASVQHVCRSVGKAPLTCANAVSASHS